MSSIKDELNYYKLNEFLDKYMKGDLNIHDTIQLKNRSQTTIYNVSFLHHTLHLCKVNKTNLLNLLNNLKNKIEVFIIRLIKENHYIKNYIQNIIDEWSLNLEPESIFNKMNDVFDYDNFVHQNKLYNELIGGMNNLEQVR